MKIKLFLFLLAILFISAPLFGLSRVVDDAGLLREADIASLENLMDNVSLAYDFDLVILTVKDTFEVEPEDYSADFFADNGYGLGKNRDGCLFLLVADRGVIWFSASGRGKKLLNSTATKRLEKDVIKSLENWDFYSAFADYAGDWEEFLTLEAKGGSYNILYRFNAFFVLGAWLVSLGIGFVIVAVWKKGMSTAIPKKQSAVYIVPGSLSTAAQEGKFLYSTVTKTGRAGESDSDDADANDETKTNSSEEPETEENSEDQEEGEQK